MSLMLIRQITAFIICVLFPCVYLLFDQVTSIKRAHTYTHMFDHVFITDFFLTYKNVTRTKEEIQKNCFIDPGVVIDLSTFY